MRTAPDGELADEVLGGVLAEGLWEGRHRFPRTLFSQSSNIETTDLG